MYLFIFTSLTLFAQTVSFHEEKFVEALELYTYRDGNVSYDENQTVISYKDGKIITKVDNTVTVQNKDRELLTTINLMEKPDIGLYFILTKALFLKDFTQLKENFNIKEFEKEKYQFVPKSDVKKVIENLELFLTKDESIDHFIIKFTNGDRIKIEAK